MGGSAPFRRFYMTIALLGVPMKFLIQLLFAATATTFASASFADSFPHCANNDAKCVGEVLLYNIRANSGGGQFRTTFCTCEVDPNHSECHDGQSYVYHRHLRLKRISDGSVISTLSTFRCENGINPISGCEAAILSNPACR